MLIDVETLFLDALVNTQAVDKLDAIEQGESTSSSPKVNHQNTEALSTEEAPTATIEGACLCGQQTGHNGTQDTAYTVYRTSTNGIVNM